MLLIISNFFVYHHGWMNGYEAHADVVVLLPSDEYPIGPTDTRIDGNVYHKCFDYIHGIFTLRDRQNCNKDLVLVTPNSLTGK